LHVDRLDSQGVIYAFSTTFGALYSADASHCSPDFTGLVVLFKQMVDLQVIEWSKDDVCLNFLLSEVVRACVGWESGK
jgi:hypothetical protein